MVPELIIFDCDGVLVDTEPIANRVLAEMLTAEGYPIDAETCMARFMGRPSAEMKREVEAELGRRLPEDFVERENCAIVEAFLAAPRVPPGLREALGVLPGRRCVASSSLPPYLRAVLGATGLLGEFERVFSAAEVQRGKPAPDLFLHAAATLGVAPEHCLVIEDAPAGVSAAVAAGMAVLGYAAATSAQALEELGATTFTSMGELPAIVAALGSAARPTR